MQITVLHNQSLFDLAIQLFGTVEAVFDIAFANDLSITDTLPVGTVINSPKDAKTVEIIRSQYKSKQIMPSTVKPNIEGSETIKKGIGHMKIEAGFIIK